MKQRYTIANQETLPSIQIPSGILKIKEQLSKQPNSTKKTAYMAQNILDNKSFYGVSLRVIVSSSLNLFNSHKDGGLLYLPALS